ncbi:MAG: M48 family metallopeptidase [Pseudomonadota bacterium]
MTEFDILYFAPGLPAHGEKARAAFDGTALYVNGQRIDIPLDEIGVTLGGFNHDQLFLFWHQEEGRHAISPVDVNAQSQLITSAPAPLSALLRGATKDAARKRRRSRFGLGVLGLFLLLPLLAIALMVWKSHDIAGWAASHISIESEQKLGELTFKQATAGMKLREGGVDAAAIREIGARLTRGSKYAYKWYVAEDPAINAFAVPGGYVVVNTGLIQAADSAEEVAGVLAHEVQHIERRHTLKNIVHSLGLRAALALVIGDIGGGALGDMAAQLSELKFSRELESESDKLGLLALKQAGISPQGMVSFFDKLRRQEGAAPPALLSTHPASEERMQALQAMIREIGAWPSTPLPYDWEVVKAAEK